MIVLRLFLLALLCDAAQLSAREKVRRTKRMREQREAAAGNAIPVQRGAGMAPAASEALPVRKRENQRRFNVSFSRARVQKKASTLRNRSER